MKRIRSVLRGREGMTLVELVVSAGLLCLVIAVFSASLRPAAEISRRTQELNSAELIADDLLETVRSRVETATEYIKCYENGADITDQTGSSRGSAVEFGTANAVELLTADGCAETAIMVGSRPAGTEAAVEKGYLLERYYDNSTGVFYSKNADGTLHRTGERCAAFWDTDSSCANCISSRAFAEHTTLNKLEFTRNEMYFVIAKYVSVNGTPCVLEMVSRLNEGRWIDANGSRFLLDRTRGEDMQLFLDPLTGVYARRYFETYRTHLESMEGVALIDVNSFKHINDTCGHAAGDAALRDIAGAIRSCIRKTDILIRYGGDEFLLLFPRMTEEIFLEKKKQIQQTVRGVRMSEFADIQLSVSVGGVCGVHPITEAIRKADYLMYLDKAEQQP